jgi:hypothetical protein
MTLSHKKTREESKNNEHLDIVDDYRTIVLEDLFYDEVPIQANLQLSDDNKMPKAEYSYEFAKKLGSYRLLYDTTKPGVFCLHEDFSFNLTNALTTNLKLEPLKKPREKSGFDLMEHGEA